ncbi:hypothetical protein V8C42DRAFT_338407 [Trichoderma barbatum]
MGLRKRAKEPQPNVVTELAWVVGHKGVQGNQRTDKLGMEGSGLSNSDSVTKRVLIG